MRFLLNALAALPAGAGYLLASLAYVLVYYVFRYRRSTVHENLLYAFPAKTAAERKTIEKAFYRHFCDIAAEILRSPRMSAEEIVDRVHFTNRELLTEATDNYRTQAIVLLIHQGNWEWVLLSAMNSLAVPVDPVYKVLHSPFWERYMLDARSRFGGTPIPQSSVAREVIRGRKRQRIIGMIADQAGPKHGGYWTNFMNRPASFYRGADKLAQTLELPVLFAQCRKLATGRYEVEFHDISRPPHADDGDTILERYVRMSEAVIAEQPETFLWTNRRWKKTPPDAQDTGTTPVARRRN